LNWALLEALWPCYWGQVKANKVLLCAQIDFSFRWNILDNLGASAMAAEGASLLGAEPTYTREAWLRFVIPQALRSRLAWELRIYGSGPKGETLIGMASYSGSGAVVSRLPGSSTGIATTFSEKEDSGVATLILSSTVDMMQVRNAKATVQVFSISAGKQGSPDTRSLIIDEEIPD